MITNIRNHPALVYCKEIEQICTPLKNLHITYFAHIRISDENKFCGLSSNPSFTEHYLKNKYYNSDIHRIDENKVGNYIVWNAVDFTEEGEKICIESAALGVHNPFTIIKKKSTCVDYYHFANDSKDKFINQIYLSNIELLNLFISYFHEKIAESSYLTRAYDYVFDINTPEPIIMTPFAAEENLIYDQAHFFKSLNLHKTSKKLKKNKIILSDRQSEILHYIVRGKTVKEIAKLLQLSPRTVGHYFENIKNKFDVYSKSELITKTIETNYIKLFMNES